MADIFDQASEREQMDRDLAIKHALASIRFSAIKPNGSCHNCGEPLEYSHNLFCDNDCGTDYERRQRAKRF